MGDPEHALEQERGHERDVSLRAIAGAAMAIAGGIAFALVASWFLLRALGQSTGVPAGVAARDVDTSAIPAPRLQTAPQPERAAYFAEKERRLASYGWVDREAGIAHIPLEEAMRLAVEAGAKRGTPQSGRGAARGGTHE